MSVGRMLHFRPWLVSGSFSCVGCGAEIAEEPVLPLLGVFLARDRRMDAGKPLFEKMLNFLHICLFFC